MNVYTQRKSLEWDACRHVFVVLVRFALFFPHSHIWRFVYLWVSCAMFVCACRGDSEGKRLVLDEDTMARNKNFYWLRSLTHSQFPNSTWRNRFTSHNHIQRVRYGCKLRVISAQSVPRRTVRSRSEWGISSICLFSYLYFSGIWILEYYTAPKLKQTVRIERLSTRLQI